MDLVNMVRVCAHCLSNDAASDSMITQVVYALCLNRVVPVLRLKNVGITIFSVRGVSNSTLVSASLGGMSLRRDMSVTDDVNVVSCRGVRV